MNLQTTPFRTSPFPAGAVVTESLPGDFDQVVLRPLKSPAEIQSVLHLREEIDLSVHAAAGPQFMTLEKKETSAGWSLPLTWMANA
jgi:hypothetical protein